MIEPWTRSFFMSKGKGDSCQRDEFCNYFLSWLTTPGRLENFDPQKGSVYVYLKEALRMALADFWREFSEVTIVSVSVSRAPDLGDSIDTASCSFIERLKVTTKPGGGFRISWHGGMTSGERDILVESFTEQEDKQAIARLFGRCHVPHVSIYDSVAAAREYEKAFEPHDAMSLADLRERWRELLASVPLPLRTRFIALHHEMLGPLQDEEVEQFEYEFEVDYKEVLDELNSGDRQTVLDVLERSEAWAYQVDHRVNERILLELFKAKRNRIPLELRVAFIAIHHRALGPLVGELEIEEFSRQFQLDYEIVRDDLNVPIRSKVLEILGLNLVWAKKISSSIDGVIRG